MTRIRPVRTEEDYEAALVRIDELMDAEANTPEDDELDVLVGLVERYEETHHPIPPPDPIAAIEFRMDQTITACCPSSLAPAKSGGNSPHREN